MCCKVVITDFQQKELITDSFVLIRSVKKKKQPPWGHTVPSVLIIDNIDLCLLYNHISFHLSLSARLQLWLSICSTETCLPPRAGVLNKLKQPPTLQYSLLHNNPSK